MKIVILASGEGKRLRPHTLNTPKPLIKIGDYTPLDLLFTALPPEIDEAIITVKYLGHKIREYCGNTFHGRKITYVEGSDQGNALGLIATRHLIKKDERFVVAYADDIISRNEMLECLRYKNSWLCYRVKNPSAVGIAFLDKNGHITEVVEKPKNSSSNLCTNGFMVINDSIFNYSPQINPNGEYYLTSMMAEFIKNHRVKAVHGEEHHTQLTTPEDIGRIAQLIIEKKYI